MNFQHQNKPLSRQKGFGLHVAILAGLVGVGSFMELPTRAWAEQPDSATVGSANAGQITAVGVTNLEVEHRSYPLHAKLEIRAEGGQPMELRQLQVGMGVRLQLKDGAVAKVLVLTPK